MLAELYEEHILSCR